MLYNSGSNHARIFPDYTVDCSRQSSILKSKLAVKICHFLLAETIIVTTELRMVTKVTKMTCTGTKPRNKSISHLLPVCMEGSMCKCLVGIWSEDLTFT